MATASTRIWCDEDNHRKYSDYADFNDWLDSEEGEQVRAELELDGWAWASKVLFAGDREAYELAFGKYLIDRRNKWLSKQALEDVCSDDHWSERNATRFDQLCDRLQSGDVVPFIGAGISQPGGFPTWKDHLRQQARTAGLPSGEIEDLISGGQYEEIVDQIERKRGDDVFIQELRDVYGKRGQLPAAEYLIADLFNDTVITTNYDRLIEQAFDRGNKDEIEVLTPATILNKPDPQKVTIIKLHGDILTPASCILSKNQYDAAYGAEAIDLSLPIPQALDYYFRNSSLLFVGCSLNDDRTIRVFEALKQRAKEENADLHQHFSIEQCPADENGVIRRNEYLLRLGITPIWFPAGQFDFVPELLRLARDELLHRRP